MIPSMMLTQGGVSSAEFADIYSSVAQTNSLKVHWNEEWKADSNQ